MFTLPAIEPHDGIQVAHPDRIHGEGKTCDIVNILSRLITSPDELALALFYTSAEQDLLLCTVNLAENSVLPLIYKLKGEDFGKMLARWRVYEPLKTGKHPTGLEAYACGPHILVCNAMTPTAERKEDFNRWYDEEHIALLSEAPSWIRSMRYQLIESNDEGPSYLAMHFWGNRAVFDSPQYKFATTTPWKFKVVDNVVAKERHVYDYDREIKR
ncbi:hypothetical protein BDN70DRAFT_934701 [Pholiota conissans]|uniref:Uncharacterized protein n=1 Tax=Pholiota conissans TaxID=109636 RepID=A0A9P5YW94_9AGAR|nr:hypothetical protein BDN70DRAFT_934701 [Pholiota conissans]